MDKSVKEMIKHLDNILIKIELISENNNNYILKYDFNVIKYLKNTLTEFKNILQNNNIMAIDLKKVKEISEIIYDFNSDNLFSDFTDLISTEYYAFEFLLQEKLKGKEKFTDKEKEINKLFSDFLKTLNLVFSDKFCEKTLELKKVKSIMYNCFLNFQSNKSLIHINPKEIEFVDLKITDFFDKYIEIEDALRNYTEILSFNLSQLEKYWKDEVIERKYYL